MELKIKQVTIFLLLVGLCITILVLGKTLFIPLSWALILCFVGLPFANYLERKKVKRAFASLFAAIVTLVFVGVVFVFLTIEASHILREQHIHSEQVSIELNNLITKIEEATNLKLRGNDDSKNLASGNLFHLAAAGIVEISEDVMMITLIPMYVFFILYYRGLLKRFIDMRYEGQVREQVVNFVEQSKVSITGYLKGTLLITAITAIMTYIVLLVFGIKYAFFFGIFLAILNLLPYIGSLVGTLVILFYVYITKDSLTSVVMVGVGIYISNFIQENLLKPKLIGDKMEMNAAVVFTAVIIGGLIWGFSGMILFIPFAGMAKAFVSSSHSSRSFAVFFSN